MITNSGYRGKRSDQFFWPSVVLKEGSNLCQPLPYFIHHGKMAFLPFFLMSDNAFCSQGMFLDWGIFILTTQEQWFRKKSQLLPMKRNMQFVWELKKKKNAVKRLLVNIFNTRNVCFVIWNDLSLSLCIIECTVFYEK